MTQGWEVKERLEDLVDAVVDSGECGDVPTTVIDLSGVPARGAARRRRGPREVPLIAGGTG